jgi:hypothetical protein
MTRITPAASSFPGILTAPRRKRPAPWQPAGTPKTSCCSHPKPHLDIPAVTSDEAQRHGESESCPIGIWPRGEERIEGVGDALRRCPNTAVRELRAPKLPIGRRATRLG